MLKVLAFAQRWREMIGAAAWLVLAAGLYLALVWAPADYYQGEVARIMDLHVPLAKTSLLAYLVTFVCSILYLWKRHPAADRLAHASVGVGIVFTFGTIAAGAIWGKPTWNVWWTWDARLVSFAVLLLLMASYLMLRAFIDERERAARFAAVLAIVGFVDLPIIHLSVRWWRTLHQPASFSAKGPSISPDMLAAMAVMTVGTVLLYVYLTLLYARRLELQGELAARKDLELREAEL